MKNPFLPFREAKSRRSFWFWLLFHLGVPALLGLSFFFAPPLKVNTLFLDMLPQREGKDQSLKAADKILGEKSGRQAIILAAANDFEEAKQGAVFLYEKLAESSGFETLSLYFDSGTIAEFAEYLHTYRFVIAGKDTLLLLEGRAEEIAYDALSAAYGAFNLFPLDNIDKDPFLLTQRRMSELLPSLGGGGLSLKDDVLSANNEGIWYVLLQAAISPEALSLKTSSGGDGKNAVAEIYSAAAAIKESMSALDFYFSGIPFHSYESSSSAQKEIAIISTIALSLIILIFLLVFRSPLPVLFSILDALTSLGMAAATALLIFREIHIITFVFGTTLIGTCVDYSIHFFIHWKGNLALKSGYEVRSHIAKSIIVCFVSTEICFLAFLFAPFPILKQFAVFSMAGLLSSFLSAWCIYPLLKLPDRSQRLNSLPSQKEAPGFTKMIPAFLMRLRPGRSKIVIVIMAALLLGIIVFSGGVKVKNDIRSLYTMGGHLLESETRAARVLDRGSEPWYFIVSGESREETLENEEKLASRLKEEVQSGNLGSYLGTTVFVPSIKTQKKTYEAMKALLPLTQAQYEYLGFPPEEAERYAARYEENFAVSENFALPEDAPAQAGISNLWIGEADGNFYSCVLPLHAGNEAIFRSIAEEFDFIHFINKAHDISRDLDTLTRTILLAFLAAYLAVAILIFLAYPFREGLKICVVPVFSFLGALAALALSQITLGFFSIAALVLVFGLGLDYIVYMIGNRREGTQSLSSLAVLLSFLTTLLSFGALSFSSFAPVHIFAITVSSGLVSAFIAAMFLSARGGENHSTEG